MKKKLSESPINYFSDLFIIAIVVMWVLDNLYESLIASAVTISSIILSFQTGESCFDTSMWASIGSNVATPLTAGGAMWLIKCGVQHAIARSKGETVELDFPRVNADGEDEGQEILDNEEVQG